MTGQNIIDYARLLAAEPSGNTRFSDANIIDMYNVASYDLMTFLRWPESVMTVQLSTQEYPLPPFLEILQVYLGGQELVPTTLSRLSGVALNFFDQTAPNFQAQWQAVPASVFPQVTTDLGYPTSAGQGPYNPWQRPQYYLRGGNIGVVPAPSGTFPLYVRMIAIPDDLVHAGDLVLWPKQFKRALCCHILMQMYESDGDTEQIKTWADKYAMEARQREADIRHLLGNLDRSPQFTTYRTYFAPPVPNTAGNVGGWGVR